MTKTLYPLLAAVCILTACNSNESATIDSGASPDSVATSVDSVVIAEPDEGNTSAGPAPGDKEALAIAELCPCVNTSLANMSPRVKRIIMDAGKHPDPVRVLTSELQKINNAEEQNRLTNELEQFQYDPVLLDCSENLKKKYNLDETNQRTKEKLMRAAERNKDCELVYALMRIADAQEKQAATRQR